MKILFLFALLINIVFFLWEINSTDLNTALVKTNADKVEIQILLVSELSRNNEKSHRISIENPKIKIVQFDFSEVHSESRLDSEPIKLIINEGRNQTNEVLSISEEVSGNEVVQDSFEQKNDMEQRNSQQTTHKLSAINQTESDGYKPPLNQKVLAEAVGEDEKNEFNEAKSFWSDFSFIFDKENNPSSQMDTKSNSKEFSLSSGATNVESSSFSEALKNWSVSIFGQSTHKEESISISQKNNNELSEIQEQVKKKYCYEVGPFASYQGIEEWGESNEISPTSLEMFKINNKNLSSYLVYHPAEDTFEQSKIIAQVYKKKGISEVWLFRKGDLRGAISFGLFKQEKRALRLQKKLIKNGLNVEIKERYKNWADHYVRILTNDETFKNRLTISEKQTINKCSQVAVQE